MKRDTEHFRGCLLGGALGDALGWPVEFLELKTIRQVYGLRGIRTLEGSSSAQITDDTQMTLFTAEGILRARVSGGADATPSVWAALQRWLVTQGHRRKAELEGIYDGWLLSVATLHASRSPGTSCITALRGPVMGTPETPVNDRKGSGGVMRAAPAGLAWPSDQAFAAGARFAAITHGHPSGYLSAGALAFLIARLIEGRDLRDAVKDTLLELARHPGHEECSRALALALELTGTGLPDEAAIARIGQGWVGEEALAIAVWCALTYREDFRGALIAAVNHDGDSDSTGAITGNILGAWLGVSRLPEDWLRAVELREVITGIADDLLRSDEELRQIQERYPVNRVI